MRKDFRIAFLNKMGFRGGAQLKTSLEAIFEHRVIDIAKLKKICHLFEIPSQYRIRVWKILLDVMPPYQEAWDLVQEQRTIEYNDIKQATALVKRVNSSIPLDSFYLQWKDTIKKYSIDSDEEIVFKAKNLAATCLALIYNTKEQYFNFQNGLYYLGDETTELSLLSKTNNTPPIYNNNSSNSNSSNNNNSNSMNYNKLNNSIGHILNTGLMSYDVKQKQQQQQQQQRTSTASTLYSQQQQQKQQLYQQRQQQQHQQQQISSNLEVEKDITVERLMQQYTHQDTKNNNKSNNNINNNSNNNNNNINDHHMILQLQIDESLRSIAEAFCYIFDNEVDAYWCFNNFLNISVNQYGHKDIGIVHQINILSRLLEIHDKAIFNHFKSLNIHVDQFCTLWFKSFFTCFVPPNSIDRVWDRIIGVSMDFMAYLSFSILQSKKSIILEKSTSIELLQYLLNFKDINLDIVLERSIELYSSTSDL